ncbi:hypothetical protein [Nisaea sp.]|uniref:hypothetical protein n=1 Tax=Nisaea sp. TaxID=2024842 RepID=UPI003B524F26
MRNTVRSSFGRAVPGAMLAVLMALALAACGEIPRPFARDTYQKSHNPFLFVPETAGIHVEPVEGPVPWVGQAMAEAMAGALVKHNVVASDKTRNRRSFLLKSRGYQQLRNDEPAELVMDWALISPEGETVGERTVIYVPPPAFWEEPEAGHFSEIAEATAPEVATWLVPELGTRLASGLPPVQLDLIEGPDDDGNAILRQTMLLRLQSRGIEVVDSSAIPDGALSLKGRIDIRPLDVKTDIVAISWRLADRSQREIGVIDQNNTVPSGSMEQSWLSAAPLIADGALEGLLPLLEAYERQRIGANAVTKRQ